MAQLDRRRRYGKTAVATGPLDWLKFTANDNNFTLNMQIGSNVSVSTLRSISLSYDGGLTWTQHDNVNNKSVYFLIFNNASAGDEVLLKGDGLALACGISEDKCTTINYGAGSNEFKRFTVSGNIMSLLYGDNFEDKNFQADYAFTRLFFRCYIGGQFNLPATTLSKYCYSYMFYCSNATVTINTTMIEEYACHYMFAFSQRPVVSFPGPVTLKSGAFNAMFSSSQISDASNITIQACANSCCYGMFDSCSYLKKAPNLPATTLANYCYQYMFKGCTSLETSPDLPATTLVSHCYDSMFYGCSKLKTIKAMFTTTPSSSYTSYWVYNVKSSGTFYKNSRAYWNVTGVNGIPSGWAVVSYS